jgi:hypothetical protein
MSSSSLSALRDQLDSQRAKELQSATLIPPLPQPMPKPFGQTVVQAWSYLPKNTTLMTLQDLRAAHPHVIPEAAGHCKLIEVQTRKTSSGGNHAKQPRTVAVKRSRAVAAEKEDEEDEEPRETKKPCYCAPIRKTEKARMMFDAVKRHLNRPPVDDEPEAEEEQTTEIVRPWNVQRMQDYVSKLYLPSFQAAADQPQQWTHEMMENMTHMNTLVLPIFTAEHEQKLLWEAGRWANEKGYLRDYPPCSRKAKCLAVVKPDFVGQRGQPLVVMQAMLPSELHDLEESNKKPHEERPCLLCLRQSVGEYAMTVRMEGIMGGDITHPSQVPLGNRLHWEAGQLPVWHTDTKQWVRRRVVQTYRNLYNARGGYKERHVLLPENGLPLVDPVAMNSFSHMRVCVDNKKQGRRWIDQSAMVWEDTQPRMPSVEARETVLQQGGGGDSPPVEVAGGPEKRSDF